MNMSRLVREMLKPNGPRLAKFYSMLLIFFLAAYAPTVWKEAGSKQVEARAWLPYDYTMVEGGWKSPEMFMDEHFPLYIKRRSRIAIGEYHAAFSDNAGHVVYHDSRGSLIYVVRQGSWFYYAIAPLVEVGKGDRDYMSTLCTSTNLGDGKFSVQVGFLFSQFMDRLAKAFFIGAAVAAVLLGITWLALFIHEAGPRPRHQAMEV